MKILIIDNNIDPDCWGSRDLCRLAIQTPGATVQVRRAPHEDLPKSPETFDKIIVSGSKTSAMEDAVWIEGLVQFIKRAIDLKKPFLGVCYGHQVLNRALGGKELVRKASEPEFGWTQIRQLDEPSPLFRNIANSFYSFSAHYDEVSQLPSGMRKLASSEACDIQACQLEKLPIFGIQFHPEKNLSEALRILSVRKKTKDPKVLLHPNRSEELYNPKLGEIIFSNFIQA
jgi:GMP synthase (glutamine-hydrolysing)